MSWSNRKTGTDAGNQTETVVLEIGAKKQKKLRLAHVHSTDLCQTKTKKNKEARNIKQSARKNKGGSHWQSWEMSGMEQAGKKGGREERDRHELGQNGKQNITYQESDRTQD